MPFYPLVSKLILFLLKKTFWLIYVCFGKFEQLPTPCHFLHILVKINGQKVSKKPLKTGKYRKSVQKHGNFLPVDSIFNISINKFHRRAPLFKTRFFIYLEKLYLLHYLQYLKNFIFRLNYRGIAKINTQNQVKKWYHKIFYFLT